MDSAKETTYLDNLGELHDLLIHNKLEDLIKNGTFDEIRTRLSTIFTSYNVDDTYELTLINDIISLLISKTDSLLTERHEMAIGPQINLLILQYSWVIQLLDGGVPFDVEETRYCLEALTVLTKTLEIVRDLTIKFSELINNSKIIDDDIRRIIESDTEMRNSLDKFVVILEEMRNVVYDGDPSYPHYNSRYSKDFGKQDEIIATISEEKDKILKKILLNEKILPLPTDVTENVLFYYLGLQPDNHEPKKHSSDDLANADSGFDFRPFIRKGGSGFIFGKRKHKTRVKHRPNVVKHRKTKKRVVSYLRKTRHVKNTRARYSKKYATKKK